MVQINDYELAELGGHWMQVLLGSGYRRLLAFAWRRRQESRVLRHVDLALCNSDFTRQAVARGYRIDATRLRTLKKAVDLRHFQSPVPPPGDPMPQRPSGSRLVFVGTDWRRKGLDVLLHCLPAVVACHPLVSLVVVGPVDGVSNEQVRRHAHDLGLESRVHFVGKLAREDIARLFWHSDVAVLPSRREALGVAVLEAMAAGLPVVATRTGGIPEIIEDGECGLLCAPGDPKDLAEKLNRVLASVDLRRSIAEGGRRKVEEFSTLRMVNALRDIYLELAERWLRGVQRDAGQCASRGASVSLL
jgi:glycosyltransferase involved in cell wall biosynthesis